MAKVLIIDDELSIRVPFRMALEREGYIVETATGWYDAETLLENEYDVILLDIKMPKVNGIEVLRRIKRKWLSTSVVIMTGDPSLITAHSAISLDVVDYIKKPIQKEQLFNIVEKAVDRKNFMDKKRRIEEFNMEYQHQIEEELSNEKYNALVDDLIASRRKVQKKLEGAKRELKEAMAEVFTHGESA